MNPQQEHHAMKILTEVPRLAKLRFELSPLKLTEDRFWFELPPKYPRH